MADITYCASADCPSKDCKRKVTNNNFEPEELISVADFSGTCRFYIGWIAHSEADFPKWESAVEALHPSDVVEVVRCKDCRHLKKNISFCPKQASYIHDGEWFCADGERKNKGEK